MYHVDYSNIYKQVAVKKIPRYLCRLASLWHVFYMVYLNILVYLFRTCKCLEFTVVTLTISYWNRRFLEPTNGKRIVQSNLLNNSSLVIINNTNETNYSYFPNENLSWNIIYGYQVLKIVFFYVTFCFCQNICKPIT